MESDNQTTSVSSPLIQISGEDGFFKVDIERNKQKRVETTQVFQEVRKQLWLAGPLISVNILNNCLKLISVMFVGHQGQLELSGASMAKSFASVTGLSYWQEWLVHLDILCGQSYGAKQHCMSGIHMQRAMLVLMMVSIPLAIVWVNTGSILIALGQDPEISAEAGQYGQFMIPSIFAYGLLQWLNRDFYKNIVFPMMFSSGVTALLHILICYVMVFKSGLGTRGDALANAISYGLMF